jgi:heme exporter protein D
MDLVVVVLLVVETVKERYHCYPKERKEQRLKMSIKKIEMDLGRRIFA